MNDDFSLWFQGMKINACWLSQLSAPLPSPIPPRLLFSLCLSADYSVSPFLRIKSLGTELPLPCRDLLAFLLSNFCRFHFFRYLPHLNSWSSVVDQVYFLFLVHFYTDACIVHKTSIALFYLNNTVYILVWHQNTAQYELSNFTSYCLLCKLSVLFQFLHHFLNIQFKILPLIYAHAVFRSLYLWEVLPFPLSLTQVLSAVWGLPFKRLFVTNDFFMEKSAWFLTLVSH